MRWTGAPDPVSHVSRMKQVPNDVLSRTFQSHRKVAFFFVCPASGHLCNVSRVPLVRHHR